MIEDKPAPRTVSTTCPVCNCVLWVETLDGHVQADHGDQAPAPKDE